MTSSDAVEKIYQVLTQTHKTLRAARGGIILSNDEQLGRKINSAVFPGLQGGPLMHAIAGKAVAFGEALKPEFKNYIETVVKNAKILGEVLLDRGLDLVSGGIGKVNRDSWRCRFYYHSSGL